MAGTSGTADDDAFAALFEEHYAPLVRLARLRHRAVVQRYVAPVARAAPPAEDEVVQLAERAAVVAAVRRLPRRQRECLVLRYYGDFSEAEIAATLGISTGSVKSHSHRGMAALSASLGDES